MARDKWKIANEELCEEWRDLVEEIGSLSGVIENGEITIHQYQDWIVRGRKLTNEITDLRHRTVLHLLKHVLKNGVPQKAVETV